ncbi:hypothetical protein EFP00_05905 [Lactiplantibacillus paraplantarum]|nr:hypothetical protein [Lactiplantibacillus paraplantarum]RDG11590.1 hypothetical protein DQM08_08165 [Lactiplantibacillus paraplantarum]
MPVATIVQRFLMIGITQNHDPSGRGSCRDVLRLVRGACKIKMNGSH